MHETKIVLDVAFLGLSWYHSTRCCDSKVIRELLKKVGDKL